MSCTLLVVGCLKLDDEYKSCYAMPTQQPGGALNGSSSWVLTSAHLRKSHIEPHVGGLFYVRVLTACIYKNISLKYLYFNLARNTRFRITVENLFRHLPIYDKKDRTYAERDSQKRTIQ